MPKRIEVKVGKEYGRLSIIKEVEQKKNRRRFLCQCDCGNIKTIDLSKLRTGNTKSCGCLQSESRSISSRTHGLCHHPLYSVWASMKARCYNKNLPTYHCYGGRQIAICEEWLEFVPFYEWAMGHGYRKGLTIERVENSGNYEPDNCTWIPPEQQARNKRTNKIITYNGKSMLLIDWGKETGLGIVVLCKRFLRGWSVEKALNTPLQNNSRLITYKNKAMSLAQWAKKLEIGYKTLQKKLLLGWSIKKAFEEPIDITKIHRRHIINA